MNVYDLHFDNIACSLIKLWLVWAYVDHANEILVLMKHASCTI